MLSILALGMLVAVGSAIDDGTGGYQSAPYGGGHDGYDSHGGNHDSGGHGYNDWLNPGGYSYSWGYYPAYYTNSWYPTYTYTYPNYYYTAPAPVVYPTYPYYDPVVYDPWYGANVYGWGGASYYYSNSWSWYNHGGYFF